MHRSDDAADTDDAAVALAALEQEAAQRIRGQARQSEETHLATLMVSVDCYAEGLPVISRSILARPDATKGVCLSRCELCAEPVPPAEPQDAQLPYVSAPAWGAWAPAIPQMVRALLCLARSCLGLLSADYMASTSQHAPTCALRHLLLLVAHARPVSSLAC